MVKWKIVENTRTGSVCLYGRTLFRWKKVIVAGGWNFVTDAFDMAQTCTPANKSLSVVVVREGWDNG